METAEKIKPPKIKLPKKLTPGEQLLKAFSEEAARQGCPDEQILNFLMAGAILQPHQLRFAALARECDRPDGPKMILAGGGRGSGKSQGIFAQIFCDDCQRVPGLKFLMLRKVGQANKEQVSDFITKLLPRIPHKYREAAPSKVEFPNGSFVILGNFKDEKDIDKYLGLEYDGIYIMESNQLTQSKKANILSCLRTNKTNWRTRVYQDTNPGGIDHVANKALFIDGKWQWDEALEKYVLISKETETRYLHSTVNDNAFVDKEYKTNVLEKYVGWQREAWLYGNWEFMAGAFFSNFDRHVHVYPNPVTTLNERAIVRWFAGLDYGYSHPNAFVLCCEDEGGNVFCVAEYTASNTLIEEHAANIRDLCALNNIDVGDLEFIAAGKDCFRVDKDGSTVATEYQAHGILLTPTHIDRVNAWSQMAEVFGDVQNQIKPRCFIHKNCTNLILQIQSAQSDPKKPNDILKMNADPETGDGGDDVLESCFVAGTMVVIPDGEIPIERIRVGQLVLTREGWKRVVACGMTNTNAKVFEAQFSHGRNLIGTAGHPIWTQRGWVGLDSLRNDDIVSICLNQKAKQSYSTESNFAAIQNAAGANTDAIFTRLEIIGKEGFRHCIRRFTSRIMGLIEFPPDFTFITETRTHLTTALKIWSAFLARNTFLNTCANSQSNCSGQGWIMQENQPLSGTIQRRQGQSPGKILPFHLENALLSGKENATSAEKTTKQNPHTIETDFVQQDARRLKKEKMDDILKKESAKSAAIISIQLNSEKPPLARANVVGLAVAGQSSVFNLTVEDCPEYFANGVLVHNCRNALVMAYSSLMKNCRAIQTGGFKAIGESISSGQITDVSEIIAAAEAEELARRG